MIPDLGKYTVEVASAYAVSIALLIGIVALSLLRGARVRRLLRETEERRSKDG